MRPVVLQAWKDAVLEAVSLHLPEFSYIEKHDPGDEKHLMKFAWTAMPGLLCGIAFRPLDESFDAFVGWSTNGKYPYSAARRAKSGSDLWDFNQSVLMVPWIVAAGKSGAAAWQLWCPTPDEASNPEAFGAAFAKYITSPLTSQEASELVSAPVDAAVKELKDSGGRYLEKRING
ncbi:hypothetical protein [Tychonema sp. BBK16]|uniref:hypothetical protein n=1 Tax=Tychonema sp. BBK16 TaxID=2699888 RepID=UPI0038D34258